MVQWCCSFLSSCVVSLPLCPSWCLLNLWRDRQNWWSKDSGWKKKHGTKAQWTWNSPANNGRPAFLFFFFLVETNARINWRAPFKGFPLHFTGNHSPSQRRMSFQRRTRKKRKSVYFVFVWRLKTETGRSGRENDRQGGGKKSPVFNNSKKVSSWAEADVNREHHRVASASVSAF